MKPKVLMIIGMHRSGTSLTTQWLHKCGLNVGSKLLEGSIGNIEGHYEDKDFLNLHCEWLVKRTLPHTGFIDHAPSPVTEAEKQQLADLIQSKNNNPEWGWKEPKTCLWLPLYKELLPDAYNLVVIRSFNETVNSMIVRDIKHYQQWHQQKVASKKGIHKLKWKYFKVKKEQHFFSAHAEEYLRIWIHYYEEIIRYLSSTDPGRFILLNYANLLKQDQRAFDRLTKEWGFTLQYVPFQQIFKTNLLSNTTDLSPYIRDKELLKKALQIEQY